MDKEMLVIGPDGYVIDLETVRVITPVFKYMSVATSENSAKQICFKFELWFKGLKKTDGMYIFHYAFKDYVDTKEELRIKIENIRNEVMKRKNGGNDIKQLIVNIDLKKK